MDIVYVLAGLYCFVVLAYLAVALLVPEKF